MQYPLSFLGVKRPGREVDQSPPISAEFKNEWSCTFAPPLLLRGRHRDDFTFLRLHTFEAIVFISQLVTVLYADSAVPTVTGTFCCLSDINSWNPQVSVARIYCFHLQGTASAVGCSSIVYSTTRLYGVPADKSIKQLNLSFASEIHRSVADHFTFSLVCIAVGM